MAQSGDGNAALRLGIHGAAGRMGKRLVALGDADAELKIAACLEHSSHPELGVDGGVLAGVRPLGVGLATTLDVELDAVIDFSVPEGADRILQTCQEQAIPLVMATTGLNEQQLAKVHDVAKSIPLVMAPSMSLAVNLAMKLTTLAAAQLKDYGPGADVEIIERHHRFKEDAPSGTALRFGKLVADQMGQSNSVFGREGRPGMRPHDEIGYHALRTGDNPGEHTIVFGMMGETLELTVKATNRDCYALGALAAAKFAVKQPPGLYGMDDVLGL